MRVQTAIAALALGVGVALVVPVFFGFAFFASVPILGGAAALVAGSVYWLIMTHNADIGIRELVKQIAVWLGIVVLLPLAIWYGVSAFSTPPDKRENAKALAKINEQIQDAKEDKDKAERDKLRRERDRLQAEEEEAQRQFYHDMFWVAYPTGLVATILGVFFPVQAVGAGLMFGGLISLATGCYAYWDRMDAWLRLGSLVVALLVLLALGTWRFWPARAEQRIVA
jgi:energy-coupling factor transporter transmembrane protein EcfT